MVDIKPRLSFNVPILINIPLSCDKQFQIDIDDYCDSKKISQTQFLNQILLQELRYKGKNNFTEFLKSNGVYPRVVNNIKSELKIFLGKPLVKVIREGTKRRWDNEGFE
jgi:hypothetical protein